MKPEPPGQAAGGLPARPAGPSPRPLATQAPRGTRLLALGLCVVLGACAQPMRVNSLATGQADRVAYELFGHNLADLRAHASQLCPQGGEVLRAAEARQTPQPSPLAALRWVDDTTSRVLPPPGSAQLLVTCDAPGRTLLAALPPPPPPASAPARKPVFKLGAGDGPGLFSRLGGAVGGLWRSSPGTTAQTDAVPPTTPKAPPLAEPASDTLPPVAPKTTRSAQQARKPVPVTGYDD